ncbi:MAG TPA: hypothetical protein VFX16_18345 [Pseudonocardiaceae bacterium]|nr:hypothetical protein [Pseudonocardiaceae bacterium]
MLRRRLPVLVTLGAALAVITACSTAGTPSAASGAASMPAPGKLLATVKSAATSASAVHIKGSFTDDGDALALDVQLNKDGSASGTIGESGTNIPVVVANKVYYVQFTKDLMSTNGIDPTSQAGQLLLNKWVPSTAKMLAGSGMVDGLKQAVDFNSLVPNLFGQLSDDPPKPAGTDTVDGIPVHVYTFSDGSKADIESAAPHYLIRLVEPASAGKGQLDFTGWDQPVKIAPPASADVYSGPGA